MLTYSNERIASLERELSGAMLVSIKVRKKEKDKFLE